MKVAFKKLIDNAVIPSYQKLGDAGLDLTATSYKYENGRHVYGTGLAVEIPEGFVGLVFPRSSIANYDLRLSNAVGVIDSNYRGEITFKFENDRMTRPDANFKQWLNDECRIYEVGNRIGQLVIMPIPTIEPIEVDSLSSSERGSGGYGSSGV